MIDKATAVSLMKEFFSFRHPNEAITHVEQVGPDTQPKGWIFSYNSKKFVQTGNDAYRLVGNIPYAISSQGIVGLMAPGPGYDQQRAQFEVHGWFDVVKFPRKHEESKAWWAQRGLFWDD